MGKHLSAAIIFDFDGTLVDSEKTIYYCFQAITNKLAPNRINYAKNILIGPPLRDTASEILGPNYQDKLNQFVTLFIQMHDDHAITHTKPYPGVDKLLKKFSIMSYPMAIATNKREVPTVKLIEFYGWTSYFNAIECSDSHSKIRNKNEMIQDIINLNAEFTNSYFVGDTVNDGISANQNKLRFINASYGFGKEQDWSDVNINKSINTFNELESIII